MSSDQRWDAILKRLPSNRDLIGAEIGIWEGRLSFELLKHRPRLLLWMVDRWISPPSDDSYASSESQMAKYPQARFDAARVLAKQRVYRFMDRAHILHCDSVQASYSFEDGSLDFVFVDGDHSYDGVVRDLEAWDNKVRTGGWIGGHDWSHHGTDDSVQRAVEYFYGTGMAALDVGNTWFMEVS